VAGSIFVFIVATRLDRSGSVWLPSARGVARHPLIVRLKSPNHSVASRRIPGNDLTCILQSEAIGCSSRRCRLAREGHEPGGSGGETRRDPYEWAVFVMFAVRMPGRTEFLKSKISECGEPLPTTGSPHPKIANEPSMDNDLDNPKQPRKYRRR